MVEASKYNANTAAKGMENDRIVRQCASPHSIHVLEGFSTVGIFLTLFYFIINLVLTLSKNCVFTPHCTYTD